MYMHRRMLLSQLGMISVATLATPGVVAQSLVEDSKSAWPGYRGAIVADSLGGIGTNIDSEEFQPLTPSEVNDARLSGITLVNMTVNTVGSYATDYEKTVRYIAYWFKEIAAHPDICMHVLHAKDIAEAKRTGRLGVIYNFQDATPIGEDLSRVDVFLNFGVRNFQLTYNRRNLVGDGCLEPDNAGISKFGHEFIAKLNERHALVDLSHAGERTTLEAIEASKAPIAITHTGCAALVPNPRNKTDKELRGVADKGGYAGIYLVPFFLRKPGMGQATAEDVILHIEHAINVCGEDHVGIGTDGALSAIKITPQYTKEYVNEIKERRKLGISAPGEDPDIYPFVPDLNRVDRFARIAELLSRRKHSDARIEKVLGGNFARLLQDVWQD
jgi:membrane dipeptidase